MNHHPPKWADRFLRWYCHPKFLEEIEGDVYELFERRVLVNHRKARFRFVWDVFRFFRWSNFKRSNSKYNSMNQFQLYANYLKLGFRNIRKNLVSSSINIFGLAIAICFAISIYVFLDLMLNMDAYHTNSKNIYQLTNYVDQDGGEELWGDSPMLLGPKILEDHPTVKAISRVEYRGASVKYETDVFDELTLFVDPSYFEMFDFPMVGGNREALYAKNQIVISWDMAVKYFDDIDPMGQELSFKFNNGAIRRFTVGAVLDKYPYNTSLVYDFFIPMDNFKDLAFEEHVDWSFLTDATLIQLRDGEDIKSIQDSFDDYVAIQNASNPEWNINSIFPIRLDELSETSYMVYSSISGGSHPAGRYALGIIALFLLGMACFNFMNISVVSASRRLKEIGLRKVMGSPRSEIIKQFLVENVLQCFFSLVLGALLAYFLLVPYFDQMIPEIDIQFRTNDPLSMVVFLSTLLFIVGVVSGAYPAFYISKFDTISIFKGSLRFGSKNLFSKIMLGFQFFLAVMTIVGCFIMTEQSIFVGEKEWGYDPYGTFSVYVNDKEQYDLLKNEIMNHPDLIYQTSSSHLLGRSLAMSSLEIESKQMAIRKMGVSSDFFEAFSLPLVNGRALSDNVFDQNNAVVVNEKFLESLEWLEDPIGRTFSYDSVQKTIVGVVENFHYYDFHSEIGPLMIHGLTPEKVHYLTIKTSPEKLYAMEDYAHQAWLKVAPNDPYDRIYQEESFDRFYQENRSNISLLMMITGIAIVLACLGLYGLLSFNVQGNLKEFSVRKVLGAEPKSLVRIVSNQYIMVLLISFVLGAPIGTWGMMQLVKEIFPDHGPITILPFLIAIGIMMLTMVLTVAGQINKAIHVNPADLLRTE